MKVIFNSLTVVAACAAIFFSFTLSSKFESEQEARLAAIADNTKVIANAEATETKRDTTVTSLKAVQEEQQLLVQSLSALTSTESGLKREMIEVESTLQTQSEEFTALAQTIQEVKDALKDLGADVTIETLGDKIAEIEGENTASQAKIEELKTLATAAETRVATSRAESQRLTQRAVERSSRIARNATEAVITAVNQDWGFVVIGAGSNSGFSPQSKLLVQRDGRLIGRLQPSSVEATQTIADIEFETLSPGVRIQSGDRVIIATPATN